MKSTVAGAASAVVAGVLLCLALPAGARAADAWVEVKSPHFIVISDAGERAARTTASDWEQLRVAVHAVWPWARVDIDRPVVVVAVKNEDDVKRFAPQFWEDRGAIHPGTIAAGGPDQHTFLVRADLSKDDFSRTINPYFPVYWSYVAAILGASAARPLPLWLEDGLASVMANTIVGGQVLQIGRMMEPYVVTLHNGEHPTIPDLVKLDRNSPWYTRADRRQSYDAMAWAFTHYLLFGDEGAHRDKFQAFVALVVQGKNADEAFASTLGDAAAFTDGFAPYINRATWPFSQMKADLTVPSMTFGVRTLTPAESNAVRASFHVEMNRPADVRVALDAAEKADPKSARAYDVEGLLADHDRREDDAVKAYGRAMELGSTSFYTYYRWAALNLRAATSDQALRARVTTAAERAAILNKLNAYVLAQLANVEGMNGNKADALAYAERAVELAPGDAGIARTRDAIKR